MPTPSADEIVIRLRVICSPMPPKTFGRKERIELAMQVKQDLQPGIERADGSMQFECEVRVKRDPKSGDPNFLGPPVHGPVGSRFLYLNWQGWEGDEQQEFRRMKIHLSSITWEQIEAVAGNERAVLEATVSGIGRDGGPAAASVPLEEGWAVVEA